MLWLRNKWFSEGFYRATILNIIFSLVCGIIVRPDHLWKFPRIWTILGGEVGFCGKTHWRMFWKTSTPWCMQCGYGCLVSNRTHSFSLLLASQTKLNYEHNSRRNHYAILFFAYTVSAWFFFLFCFLPVLLSCIIIIITLNNKTTSLQSEPNL